MGKPINPSPELIDEIAYRYKLGVNPEVLAKDYGTSAVTIRSWMNKIGVGRRRTTRLPCSIEGCDTPSNAKGMCGTHYAQWARVHDRRHAKTCIRCGVQFTTAKVSQTCCSKSCVQQLGTATGVAARQAKKAARPLRVCKRPGCTNTLPRDWKGTFCVGAGCRGEFAKTPLRVAIETKDYPVILGEARALTNPDRRGCWVWSITNGSGYPVFNGKQLHRLVLEAKHGKPLGSQAAHHICANRCCINPDHLQPVTHRDNTAEMMQRRAYRNRIAELEEALRHMDPNHPILNRIECA